MLREVLMACLTTMMFLSGCIQPDTMMDGETSETNQLPFELTFSAETLDRTEDATSEFSLKEQLEDGPVMLLWIGAGCTGCHDWTDMIREKMDEGVFENSNMTVVSVHRWGEFETKADVQTVFGTFNESDHYTPWTVVMPTPTTEAADFETEIDTGTSLYSAYGNPGTPTLQVIAPNGVLAWQSKTYWANETVFEDGFSFFERQVVEE